MIGTTPTVLVCSHDPALLDLLRQNVERWGFRASVEAWGACCGTLQELWEAPLPGAAAAMIADIDCEAPGCWEGVTRLRLRYQTLPVVFLAHDRPDVGRLRSWRPYRYLPKPFAVEHLRRLPEEPLPNLEPATRPAPTVPWTAAEASRFGDDDA